MSTALLHIISILVLNIQSLHVVRYLVSASNDVFLVDDSNMRAQFPLELSQHVPFGRIHHTNDGGNI